MHVGVGCVCVGRARAYSTNSKLPACTNIRILVRMNSNSNQRPAKFKPSKCPYLRMRAYG